MTWGCSFTSLFAWIFICSEKWCPLSFRYRCFSSGILKLADCQPEQGEREGQAVLTAFMLYLVQKRKVLKEKPWGVDTHPVVGAECPLLLDLFRKVAEQSCQLKWIFGLAAVVGFPLSHLRCAAQPWSAVRSCDCFCSKFQGLGSTFSGLVFMSQSEKKGTHN